MIHRSSLRTILFIAVLITALIWVLALTQPHKLAEGVWTLKLVGNCNLDYHANIQAIALTCPGVDYMRLWPLPVEQPWQETPDPDWVPGGYAWR